MRLCTYEKDGRRAVGVEKNGTIVPTGYEDMLALIRDGEQGLERAARAPDGAEPVTPDRLLAPIPRPGTIFGAGVNYRSHSHEGPGDGALPTEPRIDFIKTPN